VLGQGWVELAREKVFNFAVGFGARFSLWPSMTMDEWHAWRG